mmetsp:Transcript_9099/g.16669  ORF Transcript_9099/g.16669 Transcript_9099/m.16669 type:complete len:758 (+) Transcript_9099:149-2422(+)|eukprot:CAMPEP_0197518896 /NCGR_PEP_ID=MMETSP1318-20131121/4145_1 /TAXON_ID=552666 /ORGANISM="Partenskyella glossopodia, Strain RCC365" /LENGTH=757 /DNA_ID=CAMNT_0043069581 /DNA_START=66 /DNA_END=2339 /DNA_ORIENTATION=+
MKKSSSFTILATLFPLVALAIWEPTSASLGFPEKDFGVVNSFIAFEKKSTQTETKPGLDTSIEKESQSKDHHSPKLKTDEIHPNDRASVGITPTETETGTETGTGTEIEKENTKENKKAAQKYKAVILVYATTNDPLYDMMKAAWTTYMDKEPQLKVIFVYANTDYDYSKGTEDLGKAKMLNSHDLQLTGVKERYPIFLDKTVAALKYVDANFEYEYMVRTNLASFWIFDRLLKHLEGLPTEKHYEGRQYNFYEHIEDTYHAEGHLAAGWDIITSRDINTAIASNSTYAVEKYGEGMTEDFAFGVYVRKDLGIPFVSNTVAEITGRNVTTKPEISNLNSIIESLGGNQIMTRIKTAWAGDQRFCVDFPVFKALLAEFYGVVDDEWIPEDIKAKAREECSESYAYDVYTSGGERTSDYSGAQKQQKKEAERSEKGCPSGNYAYKSIKPIDLVIPTYEGDLCATKVQAISLAKHLNREDFGTIIYIWASKNDPNVTEHKSGMDEVIKNLDGIPAKVLTTDDLDIDTRWGWILQQKTKLLATKYVSSEYYLVLDSKNILVKDLTKSHIVNDCNSMKVSTTGWGNNKPLYFNTIGGLNKRWYHGSDEALGLHTDNDTQVIPSGTPFIMNTQVVNDLLEYLVDRYPDANGSSDAVLQKIFFEKSASEFTSYFLYQSSKPEYKKFFTWDDLGVQAMVYFGPGRYRCSFDALNDPENPIRFTGIHHGAKDIETDPCAVYIRKSISADLDLDEDYLESCLDRRSE